MKVYQEKLQNATVRALSTALSDPQPIMDQEYRAAGVPASAFDPQVINHDV